MSGYTAEAQVGVAVTGTEQEDISSRSGVRWSTSLRSCGARVDVPAREARWLRREDVSSGDSRKGADGHAELVKTYSTKVEIVGANVVLQVLSGVTQVWKLVYKFPGI